MLGLKLNYVNKRDPRWFCLDPSELHHRHRNNLTITPVPVKHHWQIWTIQENHMNSLRPLILAGMKLGAGVISSSILLGSHIGVMPCGAVIIRRKPLQCTVWQGKLCVENWLIKLGSYFVSRNHRGGEQMYSLTMINRNRSFEALLTPYFWIYVESYVPKYQNQHCTYFVSSTYHGA